MTIIEAINQIDEMKPNSYTQDDKVRWLSTLDWSIKKEIIDTHEGHEAIKYNGYDENSSIDTILLADAPYDEIYVRWLEAQIDYANGEYGKYNNSITAYNTAMQSYMNYYNRKHMPLQNNGLKYF